MPPILVDQIPLKACLESTPDCPAGDLHARSMPRSRMSIQGYLALKKQRLPRKLQKDCAEGPMVVLGGAVSDERGARPFQTACVDARLCASDNFTITKGGAGGFSLSHKGEFVETLQVKALKSSSCCPFARKRTRGGFSLTRKDCTLRSGVMLLLQDSGLPPLRRRLRRSEYGLMALTIAQ